jgi:hypothetical protein
MRGHHRRARTARCHPVVARRGFAPVLGRWATSKVGGLDPTGGLVRQDRRLTESVDVVDVSAFVADLDTHRDRANALAMVLSGLRAADVRGLLLANVDMGLRQLRCPSEMHCCPKRQSASPTRSASSTRS